MTVTLAMLVKDPPLDRLALLVEYVRPIVGQVVVVLDDRTGPRARPVMEAWGCEVVPFTWCDDFAAARNAALPLARGEWILHLDPDELPSAALFDFIRTVDAEAQEDVVWQGVTFYAPRGYLVSTRTFADGRDVGWTEQDWHCRLFRAGRGRWYKRVHEQVELDGMTENMTRNTPYLVKAPLAAVLLHSHAEDPGKQAMYAAIETGAAA